MAYEKYCLADTLESKLASLSNFTEGSDIYNYLFIVTKMRENKCSVENLTKQDKELFEKVAKHGSSNFSGPMMAMNLLYEFDES